MRWEFDEDLTAYTLDTGTYQAIIRREPSATWTGRLDGPGEPRIETGFTWWEDARDWVERMLTDLGVSTIEQAPEPDRLRTLPPR